ncbi:hypothetical protein ACLK2H_03680 [Escherichia coli]
MLLVAAGVFAQGLSTIGFINSLISIRLRLALPYYSDAGTGHPDHAGGHDHQLGKSPFYALVEMIPKLAHSSSISPAYSSIPMLQASGPQAVPSPRFPA